MKRISETISSHIQSVNSFIDEQGHNHYEDCVREITDELGNVVMLLEVAMGYLPDPELETTDEKIKQAYKHLEIAQHSLSGSYVDSLTDGGKHE